MEKALGEPLVLCGVCMDSSEHERKWLQLRDGADEALLLREVCVRPLCPLLQVRGHLCATHALELELAWQGNYTVRACHGCRVSTLQCYREERDVWFILQANEHTRTAFGIERRVKTPSADASDTERTGKRQQRLRKSSRFIKQHVQKEQTLAYEWSLGNLPLQKSRHLWRENQKRVEMEKDPMAYYARLKKPVKIKPDVNARPEPYETFCSTMGCKRYAKTGNRCRFHSSQPLVFIKPAMEKVTETK